MTSFATTAAFCLLPVICPAAQKPGHLETEGLPANLRDRGSGLPVSMFGTFVQMGQLIVYPFFEYYRDSDFEYKPAELGRTGDVDYRGRYRASEELIFLSYGISESIAIEVEVAIIQAKLTTSSEDRSGLPREIEELGLGDVEGQLRWRWSKETERRPEFFGYFETVLPTQDEGSLIGTTDWEFKLGSGVIRGLSSGTVSARAAVEYDAAESKGELGELALEYLRRLSPRWRIYAGVEGTQDEWELIPEVQWHWGPSAFVKINSAFGLTSKATDWAPEVGILLSF